MFDKLLLLLDFSIMAMSREHKEKLRSNRVRIVNDLDISEVLFSVLRQKKILTADMQEEIEAERVRATRAGKLLDTLVRRGKLAFESFIEALCTTSQEELAEVLDSDLCKKYNTADSYPEEFEETISVTAIIEKLELDDFLVKVSPMLSKVKEKLLGNLEHTYAFNDSKSYGRALILGNEKDENKSLGTCIDINMLGVLFQELHFETVVKEDLTSKEICALLDVEASLQKHESSAFVLCIVNYGSKNNEIYGKDGKPVKIDYINSIFDGAKCPTLKGKPKLYIIHTGEPVIDSFGLSCTLGKTSETEESMDVPDGLVLTEGSTDVTDGNLKVQISVEDKADVLQILSTSDVWRHKSKGSWFIRCLAYVISHNAKTYHLEEMIVKINAIVKEHKDKVKHLQIPEKNTTLRKNFYFMP